MIVKSIKDIPATSEGIDAYIRKHLIEQGVQARDESHESCSYRGPNKTACAVGCLIPDSEYKPIFEGDSISGLLCGALSEALYDKLSPFENLLQEWQFHHDRYDDDGTVSWEEHIKNFQASV